MEVIKDFCQEDYKDLKAVLCSIYHQVSLLQWKQRNQYIYYGIYVFRL